MTSNPMDLPFDLPRVQSRIALWHHYQWGDASLEMRALKLVEEVGEVAEAVVKTRQGHPRADEMDLPGELADVLIVLCALASKANVDLHAAVDEKTRKLPGWPSNSARNEGSTS